MIMVNSYIIGAYWGSRMQGLKEIKCQIFRTLSGLTGEDEQFANWYEGGQSRKRALEKHVTINDDSTIERLCLEQVRKGELDADGFSKMGFLFGLWTGHEEEEASNISFSVGTGSKWLFNSCVINLPNQGDAHTRLLKQETAMSIMALLVDIWKPDYAVLTSSTLRDKLDVGNEIGWITYQKSIKKPVKKMNGITYNQKNDGHWFYPVSNNYEEKLLEDLIKIKDMI